MKKYLPVIKDGLILLVVSTVFVTICNSFFRTLKKDTRSDSLVTAVNQSNLKTASEILGEKEFQKFKAEYKEPVAYYKARTAKHDEFGRTPLMWAAYSNLEDAKAAAEVDDKRVPIVDLLLKNGADVNAIDNDGWTPVMWASWSGMEKVATKLIAAGADVNKSDRSGHTALMLAAMKAKPALVTLLLKSKADTSSISKDQKSALETALEWQKKYPEKAKAYEAVVAALEAPVLKK
jgi:ankyrin repeat protein